DVGPPGSWDDEDIWIPEVVFDGSTYHMWYSGYDGSRHRIGYATSLSGVTWTKHAGNPVLDVGPPGSWDDAVTWTPSVIYDGTLFHMWYSGHDGSIYRIGYATSPDGVVWTKYDGNPVLEPTEAWEGNEVWLPAVAFDGTTYHNMWYSGYSGGKYRIGYAWSSDAVIGVEHSRDPLPSVYFLRQNYPNPFNPVSTIRYDLPQASEVSLVVYDILGREVVRLVDGYMEPSYHQVQWDGQGCPSGIYIARLATPEYTKSIKMVLLK
ncbi:MAG: T9SS type A sorting domain-containing protein, partial [Fidelibacterota bacterium]